MDDCVFCRIVAGTAPATILLDAGDHLVIEPLEPYIPGHALVIPTEHVRDAVESVNATAMAMAVAATYAATLRTASGEQKPVNLLTSVGEDATQTVFHLHVHVLPRGPFDGLGRDWPWMRPRR